MCDLIRHLRLVGGTARERCGCGVSTAPNGGCGWSVQAVVTKVASSISIAEREQLQSARVMAVPGGTGMDWNPTFRLTRKLCMAMCALEAPAYRFGGVGQFRCRRNA